MPKFLVEIPVRITREKDFGVDYEPTANQSIKFEVEANDEEDAVEFLGWLILNELDPDESEDIEPVLS